MIVKGKTKVEAKEEITTLSTRKSGKKLTVHSTTEGLQFIWWYNCHILGPRLIGLEKVPKERYNGFNSCNN